MHTASACVDRIRYPLLQIPFQRFNDRNGTEPVDGGHHIIMRDLIYACFYDRSFQIGKVKELGTGCFGKPFLKKGILQKLVQQRFIRFALFGYRRVFIVGYLKINVLPGPVSVLKIAVASKLPGK